MTNPTRRRRYRSLGYWPPSPALASSGSDYLTFPTKTLTYAKGKRVATLPVTLCGDDTAEADEEVDVRFGGGNGKLDVIDNDIDLIQSNDD